MRKSEYPKDTKTLGRKIRKKRMDLGLSLKFVADKANISESYLSRIEADKQMPIPTVAGDIARVLKEDVFAYTSLAIQKHYPRSSTNLPTLPDNKSHTKAILQKASNKVSALKISSKQKTYVMKILNDIFKKELEDLNKE